MSRAAQTTVPGQWDGRIAIDPLVLLAFCYPLSQLLVFRIVGQLYLADLAGAVLLVVMLFFPNARDRLLQLRLLFVLLGLWFGAQVVTDLLRDTPSQDYLRGWAKIAFFAVQIAALWLFLPRRRAYMIAFALGSVFAWSFGVEERFEGYEWKFGYDRAAAFAIICAVWFATRWHPRMMGLAPVLLGALALFLLFQNARSSFIVVLIAAAVCLAALLARNWPRFQHSLRPTGYATLLAVALTVAGGVSGLYGTAAESGMLGRDAQWKYDLQTEGDIPLLLGGRSESIISLQAIGDSPLIGHGSWAKDRRYVELYRSLRIRLGMNIHDNFFLTREQIPTHSFFFGAWVEAGILGAVFWLYVMCLPIMAIYYLIKRDEPLLPLVAYLSVALMWSIAFSPFGATERFFVAFQIVVLTWLIRKFGRSLVPWRFAAVSPR